ncbi:MAG TPA: acyltransferase, partial [Prevotella sp.]
KRFTRILYPFIAWCIAYAVYYVFYRGDSWSTCLLNIIHIPVNFGVEVGHLWYIYMLIGMYLLVPIVSPWLEKCSKKELQLYLLLWGITTFLPYIHLVYPQVWGEASWNMSPALYYFTGFWGYLLLGFYAKKYGPASTLSSILMILVGYAVTVFAFNSRIAIVTSAVDVEVGWDFCSINVALMTWGFFSLISKIKAPKNRKAVAIITDISACSYGMYLAHIIVLNAWHDLLGAHFTSVLVAVPVMAVLTFVAIYAIVKALSFLPKAKYWLGTN